MTDEDKSFNSWGLAKHMFRSQFTVIIELRSYTLTDFIMRTYNIYQPTWFPWPSFTAKMLENIPAIHRSAEVSHSNHLVYGMLFTY